MMIMILMTMIVMEVIKIGVVIMMINDDVDDNDHSQTMNAQITLHISMDGS